jgi:hypothetical protein
MEAQDGDVLVQDLLWLLSQKQKDQPPHDVSEEAIKIFKLNKHYLKSKNGILIYQKESEEERIFLPASLIYNMIPSHHDSITGGHCAVEKTFHKISKFVWFPNMFKIIKKYCDECEICDRNRRFPKKTDDLHPIISTKPFEIMQIDHCGPFVETDDLNIYVLTVVDHFSRKRWFLPVKSTKAEEAAQVLMESIFTSFEFPKQILSDKGSGFTSEIAEEIAKICGIKIDFAETAQHKTMGSVEISNKIMEDIIRKFVDKHNQKDWDKFVRFAAYAVNKAVSSTHGYSPDYLIFGREQLNPYLSDTTVVPMTQFVARQKKALESALKIANDELEKYRKKMIETTHGKLSQKLPTVYKAGDWVFVQKDPSKVAQGLSHKLDDRAIGPFKVVSADVTKGNVTIEFAAGILKVIKHNRLRLSKKQNYQKDALKIVPMKETEIIIINKPEDIEKLKASSHAGLSKLGLSVKDVVGKRISVQWGNKGNFPGTVIGYSKDLKQSLIYYDDRSKDATGADVDSTTDYYKENLFGPRCKWKFI